jgi:PAS domain S-box-containing protein
MGITKSNSKEKEDVLLNDLLQLENYIRAFWEFLPMPICYVNPALNILDIGKSLERLLGFSSIELLGDNLKKIFSQPKEIQKIEKELQEKGFIFDRETTLLTKEKKEIPAIFSVMARRDEKGNIVGYFFAFNDLTERKKIEQELKEKIQDLEKFHKMAVGRELKMIKLKEEIEELKAKLGKKKSNTDNS